VNFNNLLHTIIIIINEKLNEITRKSYGWDLSQRRHCNVILALNASKYIFLKVEIVSVLLQAGQSSFKDSWLPAYYTDFYNYSGFSSGQKLKFLYNITNR